MARVLVSGATGYLGSRLVRELLKRGHGVSALVREGSAPDTLDGASILYGDALAADTYQRVLPGHDTLVHLVGVARPSPRKAAQFRSVDLASAQAAISGAKQAGVGHFVYVSVAQPAPVMRAYVDARVEAERLLRESGLPATVLRPWYVLGPGHRWPLLLLPCYGLAWLVPALRPTVERLGLVSLEEMLGALVKSVERPVATGQRVIDVTAIAGAAG